MQAADVASRVWSAGQCAVAGIWAGREVVVAGPGSGAVVGGVVIACGAGLEENPGAALWVGCGCRPGGYGGVCVVPAGEWPYSGELSYEPVRFTPEGIWEHDLLEPCGGLGVFGVEGEGLCGIGLQVALLAGASSVVLMGCEEGLAIDALVERAGELGVEVRRG